MSDGIFFVKQHDYFVRGIDSSVLIPAHEEVGRKIRIIAIVSLLSLVHLIFQATKSFSEKLVIKYPCFAGK